MNFTFITEKQLDGLRVACRLYGNDHLAMRKAVKDLGITPDTYFHVPEFDIGQKAYILTINPDNKAIGGHMQEGGNRRIRFEQINRPMAWRDFGCRPAGKKDNSVRGITIEDKSGAGNWLYTDKSTLEEALEEYRQRKEWIRWQIPDYDICYICPWSVLLDILAEYNPKKGVYTFFNTHVYKDAVSGKNVFHLQEVKTSKKKLAWLAAHSIDMLNMED